MPPKREGVTHHNHSLSFQELRIYASQAREELRCLSQDFCYLRAREHGKPGSFVWRVGRAECEATLCQVVMPFFMCSRQLLSPTWPGVEQVIEWHQADVDPSRGCPAKVVGQQYVVGAGDCWLQRPGLARLDPRGSKKREQLKTACVYPAAGSKLAFPPGRHVKHRLTGLYYELEFFVVAREVAGKGQVEPGWVGTSDTVERSVRLVMYLHQLMFYLAQGYTGVSQIPCGQHDVLMHLGECKGCCCCPWHFRLGSKRENKLKSNQFRSRKGLNNDIHYGVAPEGL